MSKKRLMLALPFLMMLLTSCQTAPTPVLSSQASAVKAVPCVELPVIRFHAPATLSDVEAWSAGTLPDPGNGLDTPSTVSAIRKANAAVAAICGP